MQVSYSRKELVDTAAIAERQCMQKVHKNFLKVRIVEKHNAVGFIGFQHEKASKDYND